MVNKKLELINEQTSPLFRIMTVDNVDDPLRRRFSNNISAFHIGKGFVLSVAHNIRSEAQFVQWFDDAVFNAEILPFLNDDQIALFQKYYPLDHLTQKRYLTVSGPGETNAVTEVFRSINYDTRWGTLMQKKFCKPFLVVQFQNNQFYNNKTLSEHFLPTRYFQEPALNKYTYLVELELVEAFYAEDIALYRVVNTHPEIVNAIPNLHVNYDLLDTNDHELFCLQSSPAGFLGRLLNQAHIEGFLDQHQTFMDRIGGNYIFEGMRYLIKGYFRFGSSGAPYIFYNPETKNFHVNAIQSEACPIQLLINNSQNGNFQYINALASPLAIIKEKLEQHLNST